MIQQIPFERGRGGLFLPTWRHHQQSPNKRRAGSTYQNSGSNSGSGLATISILSFDPGSGANRGLAVCLEFADGVAHQPNPTGITVTYGGVGLVPIPKATAVSEGNWLYVIWYYLASQPSSTPSDIVASWTNSSDVIIGAVAANGVHQTKFVDGGIGNQGTGVSPQVAVRCPADSLSCGAVAGGAGRTLSAAAQTQRWNATPTQLCGAGSSGPATAPVGLVDVPHKWTQSVSDVWAAGGFYFVPFEGAKATSEDTGNFPKGVQT